MERFNGAIRTTLSGCTDASRDNSGRYASQIEIINMPDHIKRPNILSNRKRVGGNELEQEK
jgi:hypothetical protein